MKKVLHIISHTHWDREWYMSFEQHRMRLVELMDTLIEKMENDDAYCYFHLDGQTIIIEDYLEIRPSMRERLFALINSGRIQVGPWYILQDEYLTSGEANIRNLIEGLKFCRENGIEPVMSGYMPDAFGNIAQLPQILAGFDIDNAIFGRGIWAVLSNNEVAAGKKPADKELRWRGADGTEIIGLMFGDWYHNANEMPSVGDKKIEKTYGDLINHLNLTAKTPYLLGMNGCDHQPVQLDLPQSISKANEIFADTTEVKHSNFKDYIELLRPYSKDFKLVEGEIAGQYTKGKYLLVNTASTHIPLKQKNHSAQNMLAYKSEPASAFASLYGDSYRSDMLRYSWKTLMQNHPHDSICCCSCDAVTREMNMRFDKAYDTADFVLNEAMSYIADNVDTSKTGENNIVVFHTNPQTTSHIVETEIQTDKYIIPEQILIRDFNGNYVPATVDYLGKKFTYTLPKDKFRQVKYKHIYRICFSAQLSGIGCYIYSIVNDKTSVKFDTDLKLRKNGAENKNLKFSICSDGTINLMDKNSGHLFKGLNKYEDVGDCGDSYNFIQTKGRPIYPQKEVCISLIENSPVRITYEIVSNIAIPAGLLNSDRRSEECINHEIHTFVTLNSGVSRLDIKTEIVNKSENHRIRAIFPSKIDTSTVLADGQFDVISRNITPWEGWKNPSNCQRMQSFFALEDDDKGLLIAGRGLNEYEILRDGKNTMALTLLRAVGEIGDWGDFPTPDMQLKDKFLRLEYSIIPYAISNKASAYNEGYTFAGDFICVKQTNCHKGEIIPNRSLIEVDGNYISFSALKKAEDGDGIVLRLYSVSEHEESIKINLDSNVFKEIYESNLAEQKIENINGNTILTIAPKKIKTYLLK